MYNVESVSVIVSTSHVGATIRDQELQFEDFSLGFAGYDAAVLAILSFFFYARLSQKHNAQISVFKT